MNWRAFTSQLEPDSGKEIRRPADVVLRDLVGENVVKDDADTDDLIQPVKRQLTV